MIKIQASIAGLYISLCSACQSVSYMADNGRTRIPKVNNGAK
ncbi:MAG: hypothetical protein OFPI_03980 [Osedax symbiont Rs2]|nr:MAG: hypothetical protein OFPI_03980 [Osedax symbiont Rs2]